MMDAESIARGLDKPRRYGGSWMACCPVESHDDRNPSLSISDGTAGKTLVKCFAGCSQQDVIDALRDRGLWPNATHQQKHNQAQRERHRLIEHHKFVLRIAQSDLKKSRPVTDRMREEIRLSLEFLQGACK